MVVEEISLLEPNWEQLSIPVVEDAEPLDADSTHDAGVEADIV